MTMREEVIMLDSDGEEDISGMDGATATASVAIVNSRPLDLQSLGIGTHNGSTNGGSSSTQGHSRSSHASQYRKSMTVQANRIKSKTTVGYTQEVLPLPPRPPQRPIQRPLQSASNTAPLSTRNNTSYTTERRNPEPQRPVAPVQRTIATNYYAKVPNTERIKMASDFRMHNYNFEAFDDSYNADKHAGDERRKFLCSFPKCKRVLEGNCAFVNHLWAHVSTWKEFDEKNPRDSNYRTDVDQLKTCPQCLARFHSPHLMQVHYCRAHSRVAQISDTTCTICEKDVGIVPNALRLHLALHDETDAPYFCKLCKYRCTVRLHLIDHFQKKHANTSALMCPFCTHTIDTTVGQDKQKESFIRVNEFVKHIADHENSARVACEFCACAFADPNEKMAHRKDHFPLNPRWKTRARNPETASRIKSVMHESEMGRRLSCRQCRPPRGEKQFSISKCIKCTEAVFRKSFAGRRILNVGTKERTGKDTTLITINEDCQFVCECGLKTSNGQLIMGHWTRTQHNFEMIELPKPQLVVERTAEEIAEEEIFSGLPPKKKPRAAISDSDFVIQQIIPVYCNKEKLSTVVDTADRNLNEAVFFFKKAFVSTEVSVDTFKHIDVEVNGDSRSPPRQKKSNSKSQEPADHNMRNEDSRSSSDNGIDTDRDDSVPPDEYMADVDEYMPMGNNQFNDDDDDASDSSSTDLN